MVRALQRSPARQPMLPVRVPLSQRMRKRAPNSSGPPSRSVRRCVMVKVAPRGWHTSPSTPASTVGETMRVLTV